MLAVAEPLPSVISLLTMAHLPCYNYYYENLY